MSLNRFIDPEKKEGIKVAKEDTHNFNFVNDSKLNFSPNDISKLDLKEKRERFLPWFLKYQAKKFDDLVFTEEVNEVINYLDNFKKGKGLLLFGVPGCGKTTTVNLIAKERDFEIVEVNASDTRNKKSINEFLGNAVKQKSLFAKSKLILVDEVDGVSGREDRGGVSEVVKIIKESNYPIILTANDVESNKIKALKKVCKFVNFDKDSQKVLLTIAKRILDGEGVNYKEEILTDFVKGRNLSDIRGFINDLQGSLVDNKLDFDYLEERDYKKIIENLLTNIVSLSPEESYYKNFNTDVNLDSLLLYLEENLPNIKGNYFKAFDELSKADVYKGRIMKWQYWRYLVYISFYMNYAISNAVNSGFITSKKNTRILKKWIYNNSVSALKPRTKIQKKKGEDEVFIEKLAKLHGCSVKKTKRDIMPYFLISYKNDSILRRYINSKLEVDDKIKSFLISFNY